MFHQSLLLGDTPGAPWGECIDEVCLFVCLLPMAFTNLKVGVRRTVSCSDASAGGGGAAEAKEFVSILEERKSIVVEDTLARYLEDACLQQDSTPAVCSVCKAALRNLPEEQFTCARRCRDVL